MFYSLKSYSELKTNPSSWNLRLQVEKCLCAVSAELNQGETLLVRWKSSSIYLFSYFEAEKKNHMEFQESTLFMILILNCGKYPFSLKSTYTSVFLVHYVALQTKTFVSFYAISIDAFAASKQLKVTSERLLVLEINIQTNKQTNHIYASPKKLEMVDFILPHKNLLGINDFHPLSDTNQESCIGTQRYFNSSVQNNTIIHCCCFVASCIQHRGQTRQAYYCYYFNYCNFAAFN